MENEKWKAGDQVVVFRHRAALGMLESGTLLDIGCGDGLFMSMAREKGVSPSGLDISEEAARKCRLKGLDCLVFDASRGGLPFKENEFDGVAMLDVLEHLFSPEILLAEAGRVAGKYIVLSVPNFNSLPARLQVLLGRVPENNRSGKLHAYWFNDKIIRDMIEKNGLIISRLAVNTFWENKFLLGHFMKFLARLRPSLFALSFVFRLELNKNF